MKSITEKLASGLSNSVFPGAVLLIAHKGKIIYHQAAGVTTKSSQEKKELNCATYFDLASLTKPLVTAAAVAVLLDKNELSLKDVVSQYLPGVSGPVKNQMTLFHLLNHCAGLPAWKAYYKNIIEEDQKRPGFLGSDAAKKAVFKLAQNETLIAAPGEKSLYSDIGFILLQEIIEIISGTSLDQFFSQQIASSVSTPLESFFRPIAQKPDHFENIHFAPTEDVDWRGGVIEGLVHDHNAFVLGGVAGHAGLFSTAAGVYQLVGLWQDALDQNKNSVLFDPQIARLFTTRQIGERSPAGSSWALGWDTPSCSPDGLRISSSGQFFSANSFGHLGFTGTSIWVDPENKLTVIFLSHRVHPDANNNAIRRFRPELHDIIFKEVIHG